MGERVQSPRRGRPIPPSTALPDAELASRLSLEDYLSSRRLTPQEYRRLLAHLREAGASFRPAPVRYPFVNPVLLTHLTDRGVDVSQTSITAMGLPEWAEAALTAGEISTVHELASASTFVVRTVLGFSGRPYNLLRQRTEQYLLSLIEAAGGSGDAAAAVPGLVEQLNLSPRTIRALRRAGIFATSQLARMTPEELSRLKGIGPKIALELQATLPSERQSPRADPGLGVEVMSLRPAVARRSLRQTDIPVALLTRLDAAGIRTVGQLARAVPDLSSVPRIGPVSSQRIRSALEAYLLSTLEQASSETEPEPTPAETQTESLENRIAALVRAAGSPRAELLLRRRFGLDGRAHTLAEIGQELGVTRERARQIERLAVAHVRDTHRAELDALLAPMHRLLAAAGGTVPLAYLVAQLPLLYILGTVTPSSAVRFLLLMSNVCTQIPNRRVAMSGAPVDAVGRLDEGLTTLLRRYMSPMSVEQVTAELAASPEYAEIVRAYPTFTLAARAAANPTTFLLPGGEIALQGWRHTRIDNVVAALRALGKPAHFRTIAEVVSRSADSSTSAAPVSVQAIHNLLLSEAAFVRTGRGTFGLWEWSERDSSVSHALNEQMQNAGRAMHPDELAVATGLNMRTVERALISEPEFVPMDRGLYRLRAWASSEPDPRSKPGRPRGVVAETGVTPDGASYVGVTITRSTYRSGTLALNSRLRPLFPSEGDVQAVWHGGAPPARRKLHRGRSHISGLSRFIHAHRLRPGDLLYLAVYPGEPSEYHLYTGTEWRQMLRGNGSGTDGFDAAAASDA